MSLAPAGGAASEAAGLQRCDRSKITFISTTEPKEGGFGKCHIAKSTCTITAMEFCVFFDQPLECFLFG
jgi:hypothetical protein